MGKDFDFKTKSSGVTLNQKQRIFEGTLELSAFAKPYSLYRNLAFGIMNLFRKIPRYLYVIICMSFYIILLDVTVNIIFHYPSNLHTQPSKLQDYFEYGRSVESKLQEMTRISNSRSSPRVLGGWLNSDQYKFMPSKTLKPGQVLIALYGMSHTKCLWEAISKIDKRFLIRGFMAAGATPNWSYAAYELDRGRHKADVVILGIMTDSVPLITTTTGMTAYFDESYPYTFPRYRVKKDKLSVTYPPFNNVIEYREYLYGQSKWYKYREWLSKNDKYYDPVLFKKSMFDHSAFFRLFRRAYAERGRRLKFKSVLTDNGFYEKSEAIITLNAMVKSFAESARKDDIIPIIYIVNNQDRSDYLFRVLKPVLDLNKIPYLSTHIICPPSDPRVFLKKNSHFTPEKDLELAKEMIRIINKEIKIKKSRTIEFGQK